MTTHARGVLFTAATLIGFLSPTAVHAQKVDSKKWLEQVRAIILPEEEKTYRSLKDGGDIEEFQKIFWARRDPNLETADNEFQTDYLAKAAEADRRYKGAGRAGSATDCGRLFMIIGPPDEAKADPNAAATGPRPPETWTYKDRPGFTFQGGRIDLQLNSECQLAEGSNFRESFARIAGSRVVHPDLDYRIAGGHLVKLADLLPKPSPALALLKQPRQDFPLRASSDMMIRSRDGATYVAGLVRGEAAGLEVQDNGGKKLAKVSVVAQMTDAAGKAVASVEREVLAEVGADNALTASYGLTVRPGKYTLSVAALDPKSQKGSVASTPLDVTDFDTGELVLSKMLVLRDIAEVANPDPKDALAAFSLGSTRLVPQFGNVFSKSDSIQLLCAIYGPKADPQGKRATLVAFSILKDGKEKAKAPDQTYDNETPTPSVGPVPLSSYEPGSYVVRIRVKDTVAGRELTQDASFEVR